MRSLAERAGVSPATPYNLFGSKRAILVSVRDDIRGFGQPYACRATLPPFERILHALVLALTVGDCERDPEFYPVLWKTTHGSDASEDRNAIVNPRRDAFRTQLLQDAADTGPDVMRVARGPACPPGAAPAG